MRALRLLDDLRRWPLDRSILNSISVGADTALVHPSPQTFVRVVARPQPAHPLRRILAHVDPVLLLVVVVFMAAGCWIAAPGAVGAGEKTNASALLNLKVPITTAVLPGWTPGDTSILMPNLSIPGESKDALSDGWVMSTNWQNGYEVRIRSTTDPAMKGANAVDGRGATDSFADFNTGAACPCAWTGSGYSKGVFGFSASVVASSGDAALNTSQWGTAANRRWRGLDNASYRVYSTPGGEGQYRMTLYFRSMIPQGATQTAGSYRTTAIVSVHPLFAPAV